MIHYKVIVERTHDSTYFSQQVQDALNTGWVLEGALQVGGGEKSYLAQALIKDVEDTK